MSEVRHADAAASGRAGERAKALTMKLAMLSCNSLARVTSLDLDTTIADLAPALRHLLADDIELVIKRSPVQLVLADPHHIEQVVTHLVVNAGEALSDGGALPSDPEVVHDPVGLPLSANGAGRRKGGGGGGKKDQGTWPARRWGWVGEGHAAPAGDRQKGYAAIASAGARVIGRPAVAGCDGSGISFSACRCA